MNKTQLVGILNITPDSFSDGGFYSEKDACAKQLNKLIDSGADIIDIGAVSTRPKSIMPSATQEIQRYEAVLPSIIAILKDTKVKVSIDSPNFETIKFLIDKISIDWVNDQSGFLNKNMINLLKKTDIKLVIMHHTVLPVDPLNIIDSSLNIFLVVKEWLLTKADYLISQGIRKEQIILDPGIGFGKNADQSWELIRSANEFVNLGFPVLYGHSRKSFLNLVTDVDFAKRDFETSVISSYLASKEIDFLRVHDINSNKIALRISSKIRTGS